MAYGKGALAQLGMFMAFFMSLREMGHQGIAMSLHVYDRAFLRGNGKIHAQHHQTLHGNLPQSQASSGRSPELIFLLDWVLWVGCAIHDCANSVKRSLHMEYSDPALMKNLYIVIASVRHSYDLVLRYIGTWATTAVSSLPEGELPSPDVLHEVYELLLGDSRLKQSGVDDHLNELVR